MWNMIGWNNLFCTMLEGGWRTIYGPPPIKGLGPKKWFSHTLLWGWMWLSGRPPPSKPSRPLPFPGTGRLHSRPLRLLEECETPSPRTFLPLGVVVFEGLAMGENNVLSDLLFWNLIFVLDQKVFFDLIESLFIKRLSRHQIQTLALKSSRINWQQTL